MGARSLKGCGAGGCHCVAGMSGSPDEKLRARLVGRLGSLGGGSAAAVRYAILEAERPRGSLKNMEPLKTK